MPFGDPSQVRVAAEIQQLAQPAREDQQQDDDPDPGRDRLPPGRQEVLRAADVSSAEDGAGQRPESADHDHREQEQAHLGAEGVGLEDGLVQHVERAREPG